MFYGTVVWDPWLIVSQIVCLRCLYYLTLGVFLSFVVGTRLSRMSLVYFFDFATVTTSTVTGWCVTISFLLSSIAGIPWLIVAQIVCLQCLYYLTLGVFSSFLVGTRVSRMSLVYFFDFATVTTSTVTGWCVTVSFLLSSIAG
ncbi:hypothetical protein like AT1G79985 [Hibiscus trionum]|nr:hypothetical protein like AT1G79985 [Hibiscus trionum]